MGRRYRNPDDADDVSASLALARLFSQSIPGLADPAKVCSDAFSVGYLPNERLLVSELADRHRKLTGVGASEPGDWRTDRTPYLREIMDYMSAGSPIWKQSFVSGAQTGKSEAGNNMLFAWMSSAPGPIMLVLPSAGVAKKVSKQRLTPMIQSSNFLRSKVTEDLQLSKEFHCGILFLASAESGADLRSLPIRYLYCDEVDAYCLDVNGEGPPVGLAMRRTNTFKSKRKVYLTSTSTKEATSVIWKEFLLGDQRLYHMPCPDCSQLFVFEFEGLKWTWGKAADTVHYECPHCKFAIQEYRKATLLPAEQWIPTRPDLENVEEGVRSYRLNSLYSPLGWLSWSDIAVTINRRAGVYIDEYGGAIGYSVRKTHEQDAMFGFDPKQYEWEDIPAYDDFGRPRFILAFERERPGQHRGVSLMSAVMAKFKVASEYESAELQAALANAVVAAVTESTMDMGQLLELFGGDALALLNEPADYVTKLQNGAVMPLFPGDRFSSHAPARPNTAFPAFMTSLEKRIASGGFDLPRNFLMRDFDQGSYVSIKMAFNSAWRSVKNYRGWVKTHFYQPIYDMVLEEAVGRGLIDADSFYEKRRAWTRCDYIFDGAGWLDPVREAQASQLRIASGISTLQDECAEQGKDREKVLEQRAAEQKRVRELNLDLATIQNAVSIAPQLPIEPVDQNGDN